MIKVGFEGDEFTIPAGELQVRVESRDRRLPENDCITAVKPAYLTTVYDELTRNFVTMSVAASLPVEVETVKYVFEKDKSPEAFPDVDTMLSDCSPLNKDIPFVNEIRRVPVLQHFNESDDITWKSTLRTVPPNTKHLLNRYPSSDYNIFFKYDSSYVRDSVAANEPFEPLFASFAFYQVGRDKRATRISESLRIDLTPAFIKEKFPEAYFAFAEDATIDPVTKIAQSVCAIPEQLKKQELFLVVHIHKVLSGDTSAALAPYLKPSYAATGIGIGGVSAKDKEKFDESCKRLKFYRQQIGIGAIPVFDSDKAIQISQRNMQVYCTRSSLNDDHIGEVCNGDWFVSICPFLTCVCSQFVHDLYPSEGNPRGREATQINIMCTLLNVGVEKQVCLVHGSVVMRSVDQTLSSAYEQYPHSVGGKQDFSNCTFPVLVRF
jgi:hypothetical protein